MHSGAHSSHMHIPLVHGHIYRRFDGDGMLHSVQFKDSQATYCNRFVETSRLAQERKAKRPLFLKVWGGPGQR